ncbi:MAG: O-antigen ligase family protein [Endozoicomonas sp.]|uniref:O-antigen ligase family protein n=1 Tax=Endozoicomonas sp. TaxID=1892382 RepID=UPI003D9B17B1
MHILFIPLFLISLYSNTYTSDIFVFVFVFSTILWLIKFGRKASINRIGFFSVAFFLYVALSPLWSVNYQLSILQSASLILPLLVYGFFVGARNDISTNVLTGFFFAIFITSLDGVYDYMSGIGRVDGQMLDANAYSASMYLASLLGLVLVKLRSTERLLVSLIWFAQLSILIALFATGSRAGVSAWALGFFGFIVIAFFVGLDFKHNLYKYFSIALFSFLVVKISPLILDYDFIGRDFSDLGSVGSRLPIWMSAVDMFKEEPLFGHGLASFSTLYPTYREEFITFGAYVHNDFIQFALEGGLVLLSFLLLIVGYHLCYLYCVIFGESKVDRKLRLELGFLITINLALLSHAFFNFIVYVVPLSIAMAVIFARIRTIILIMNEEGGKSNISDYKKSKIIIVFCVLVFLINFFLTAMSGLIYRNPRGWDAFYALARKPVLIDVYSLIQPSNIFVNEVALDNVFFRISSSDDTSSKIRMIKYAKQQLDLLLEKHIYSSKVRLMYGSLAYMATKEKIYIEGIEAPEFYFLSAVELNPGDWESQSALVSLYTVEGKFDLIFEAEKNVRDWYKISSQKAVIGYLEKVLGAAELAEDKKLIDRYNGFLAGAKAGDQSVFDI